MVGMSARFSRIIQRAGIAFATCAFVAALGCVKKQSETASTTPPPGDSLRHWPADTALVTDPFGPPSPALRETLELYVSKLNDRSFWVPYGEEEEPSKWWLAAERLGEVGAPAIPSLMNQIADADSFKVMLALYGLLLASQDPEVLKRTNGEHIDYHGVVLDSSSNAAHSAIALSWWEKHHALWERTPRALP